MALKGSTKASQASQPRAKKQTAATQPAKGKTATRKPGTKKVEDPLADKTSDSEEDEDAEGEEAAIGEIEWTTDLTWTLVNSIRDNTTIKQGLFPTPGGNKTVSQGGSRTKSDYYYALACLVFQKDERYALTFLPPGTKKDPYKKGWTLKVKNKLTKLVKDARNYIKEMGETGAGIKKEAELDMTKANTLTNCWSRIRDTTPWFWELKGIISERPNLIQVGIGNNEAGYDTSILMRSSSADAMDVAVDDDEPDNPEITHLNPAAADNEDDDEEQDQLIDDWEVTDDERPKKRKREVVDEKKPTVSVLLDEKKPTAPRAGKSTPTDTASRKKTKTAIERFADVTAQQEETAQKALDLKRARNEGETAKVVAKIKAQAEVKMNRDRLRAELAMRRWEMMGPQSNGQYGMYGQQISRPMWLSRNQGHDQQGFHQQQQGLFDQSRQQATSSSMSVSSPRATSPQLSFMDDLNNVNGHDDDGTMYLPQ